MHTLVFSSILRDARGAAAAWLGARLDAIAQAQRGRQRQRDLEQVLALARLHEARQPGYAADLREAVQRSEPRCGWR